MSKFPRSWPPGPKLWGLALEVYIEQILAQETKQHRTEAHTPHNPKEIRAWLDSLAQFSDKVPPLPESITREWIYQDHD